MLDPRALRGKRFVKRPRVKALLRLECIRPVGECPPD
jgi:hypothetical protein